MRDLTVYIITSGEASFQKSLRALEKQTLVSGKDFNIEVIRNVYPMSEAFNQMHMRCQTPFFVQVDADMILRDFAINYLYEEMRKCSFLTYVTYGQLYEDGFGIGGSVRCWRQSFFKFFKFRDVRTVDRDIFSRAQWFGFRRKKIDTILGVHDPHNSIFTEYLKTKSDIEKWRYLKRHVSQYALPLLERLLEKPQESKFRLLGAFMGALSSKEHIMRSKNIKLENEILCSSMKNLGYDRIDQLEILIDKIDFCRLRTLFKLQYQTENNYEELLQIVKVLFSAQKNLYIQGS